MSQGNLMTKRALILQPSAPASPAQESLPFDIHPVQLT